ncbi:MAG: phosphate uptake regulator PhoU [archaeon]|nr:phosphate uptake regulator PhoU [archaeon]MCP8314090.1 phosphate uptake regulator PhoU [archaeon]MCP8318106.1 phosphate uptake regulator PhoU [archaeon]MCP8321124.1 phosphate uptake regulator PhoU [archaeon]
MEVRKVQEMGGGTLLISLPKEWVKQNMVKRGSILTVEARKDGFLIIYPFQKEEKPIREITIQYPAEYIEYLINEITGNYLLGYDLIKIQGKERITYEDREKIKKAVRQLIGLEIVEEDARSMITQFLLEPTTLTPEKILRRMHMISRGMHKDAITSLIESDERFVKVVAERDDEVDRLHFLLVRLIRSALLDSRLLNKLELNQIDCLDYRVASSLLETIGDASVEMAKTVLGLPKFHLNDNLKIMLKESGEILEKMQDFSVKAFLMKDVKDARQVVKLFATLSLKLSEYEKSIPNQPLEVFTGLSSIFASISKIGRCHVDIADLAVTMYPIVR